ncbi:hypothetical protein GX50_02899 [[Emmonsia] crescens]|uniref:Phospholipase/carboxylesterase/thioesterase domain-containing protein n=1 Tax=[Emmonsia] crescens TaxID=73230 RepID=A0A2B7ZK20_9EURO|nr:hypothetical protein GX50_02899 [Emmonsia crescens]
MSGYLPFNRQIEDIFPLSSRDVLDEDTFNPFAQSPPLGPDDSESAQLQPINHIRDILNLPMLPVSATHHFQSPVFLGHGSADEKVSVNLVQCMIDFLQKRLDMNVTGKCMKVLIIDTRSLMRLMTLFVFGRRRLECLFPKSCPYNSAVPKAFALIKLYTKFGKVGTDIIPPKLIDCGPSIQRYRPSVGP